MEEESWRRYPGGGIIEEESWRRNHGGGIMEEESWRRYPGGGIMEEESWRMYPGGKEEVSWRRHHEEEQWHPGTQEAPRKHPGGTQVDPGGTQVDPGGTQEAPRGPGTSWSQNVSYHMRLRTKVMRVTIFACTGAT